MKARLPNYMLLALMGLIGAGALLVVFGAPHVERALLYHPFGGRVAPEDVGLSGISEIIMPVSGGEKVIAWYAPARRGRPTVLYFHGNGASLGARSERIRAFQERGLGLFMMSYRGYSGSSGVPSEADNVNDAKRAFDLLVEKGVPVEKIIVYGESLGTGVAVQVSADKPAAGLVLDAPYTSIVDVATLCYPYLPSRLFMRDRYETLKYLKRVKMPTLILHGERDRVIPVAMGRAVADAAPGPVKFVTFAQAGHTDHNDYGSMDVLDAWIAQFDGTD